MRRTKYFLETGIEKVLKNRSFLMKIFNHFGPKNDVIGQNLGKVVKKFYLEKFLKFISVRFMDINVVKNAIIGVNLVNRSFLVKMVQFGSFWMQNDVIGQYLAKVGKNIISKS